MVKQLFVHSEVETIDKNGEISTIKPEVVQVLPQSVPYKTTLDGHSSGKGDDEVNNGPYLFDDTGHVDLETLYKRSISQGVIPLRNYEFELEADTPLENIDPDNIGVDTETPNIEVSSPSGGTPIVNEPTVEQTATTA